MYLWWSVSQASHNEQGSDYQDQSQEKEETTQGKSAHYQKHEAFCGGFSVGGVMPARSKAQRRLMGACEHGADFASCPKHMTHQQMHDFAATPEKGLPVRISKKADKNLRRGYAGK